MASRKPHITDIEVLDLDLFDRLMDTLDAEDDKALASAIVGAGRDSRRRFRGTVRSTVWTRDGGVCWYCGATVTLDRVQIDHVIPWSRGGRTVEDNGVTSCAPCNRSKSNKVW